MNEQEYIRLAQKLIQRFDNMRIVGARGEWSGNARQGFMFNPQRGGGSPGGVGPIPPTETGACCLNGECSITTRTACELSGGTYQGDGTTCDEIDCTQETSGACCIGEDCSIETPSNCEASGGIYQGDNTTCDPNPCRNTGACCVGNDCSIQTRGDCAALNGKYLGDNVPCEPNLCPDCICGFFNACDGKYYKTLNVVASGNQHTEGFPLSSDWEFTSEVTYTCAGGTVGCSGSGTGSVTGGLNESIHGSCDGTFGGDTNVFMALGGGISYWFYDGSANCSPCPKNTELTWVLTTDECDHKQYTLESLVGNSGTVDAFYNYSDPCV